MEKEVVVHVLVWPDEMTTAEKENRSREIYKSLQSGDVIVLEGGVIRAYSVSYISLKKVFDFGMKNICIAYVSPEIIGPIG